MIDVQALELRAIRAEIAVRALTERVRELEDRMYGPMARCVTSYYDTDIRTLVHEYMITIQPKTYRFVLLARAIHIAEQPDAVVQDAIEAVLRAHTSDLRKQFHEQAIGLGLLSKEALAEGH